MAVSRVFWPGQAPPPSAGGAADESANEAGSATGVQGQDVCTLESEDGVGIVKVDEVDDDDAEIEAELAALQAPRAVSELGGEDEADREASGGFGGRGCRTAPEAGSQLPTPALSKKAKKRAKAALDQQAADEAVARARREHERAGAECAALTE